MANIDQQKCYWQSENCIGKKKKLDELTTAGVTCFGKIDNIFLYEELCMF